VEDTGTSVKIPRGFIPFPSDIKEKESCKSTQSSIFYLFIYLFSKTLGKGRDWSGLDHILEWEGTLCVLPNLSPGGLDCILLLVTRGQHCFLPFFGAGNLQICHKCSPRLKTSNTESQWYKKCKRAETLEEVDSHL
jgi:hypothetical protein